MLLRLVGFLQVCLLLAAVAVPSVAQPTVGPASPARDRGWTTASVGPGTPGGFAGALTVTLGRTHGPQAGAQSESVFCFGDRCAETTALHAGYAVSDVGRWHRVAVGGGPALVFARDVPGADLCTTVGAAANVQAMVTPVPEIGIGVQVVGILSPVRPAAGVLLMVAFEGNK